MDGDTYAIYQDKRGAWRWRWTAADGDIVGAASHGFATREECEANMNRRAATDDVWEFFQDKRGRWRWRWRDRSGEIVGAATEGFSTRADCVANAARRGYASRE